MGRAVRCELSCGQATPPRGSVAEPFYASSGHIQATCELLAAPLDAILTDIEREDIHSAAWAKESAELTFATRLRHCWR